MVGNLAIFAWGRSTATAGGCADRRTTVALFAAVAHFTAAYQLTARAHKAVT
ncbi:hypothetical protein K7G98_00835 [Saccharothrix sp. MB29]|nr:hypothetical protein [Saccharothrix sp. MB29]